MNKRKAFTIVELLTSLVIIALLVSLLLPSISAVRRHAKETAQKAQIATIEMALDAFKQDYGDYPPSNRFEVINPSATGTREYCGAMKLAEALLGWDLQGFHPKTAWRREGYDSINPLGNTTYDPRRLRIPSNATLFERKGPYLELAKTNVFHIGTYTVAGVTTEGLFTNSAPFNPYNFVICDVFGARKLTDAGKTVLAGSPVLYYRANTASKTIIPPAALADRIYDFQDNQDLLLLGKFTPSGAKGANHPLLHSGWGPTPSFYEAQFNYNLNDPPAPPNYGGSGIGYGIRDPKITQQPWPYRPDSYILISAGADGLYGTADDIHNY